MDIVPYRLNRHRGQYKEFFLGEQVWKNTHIPNLNQTLFENIYSLFDTESTYISYTKHHHYVMKYKIRETKYLRNEWVWQFVMCADCTVTTVLLSCNIPEIKHHISEKYHTNLGVKWNVL